MSDDALIEAMARDILALRGVAFYTDPMEGGQDAYDISCEAVSEATAALAAIRKTHAVVPKIMTVEMADAAIEAMWPNGEAIYSDVYESIEAAVWAGYRAMLSAGENHDGK